VLRSLIPFPSSRTTLIQHTIPEAAHKFWRILVWVDQIFKEFRAGFQGKASPVHFFWGSFDLAVTRFSGRPAPERPGADSITREAYSHEVSSAGDSGRAAETSRDRPFIRMPRRNRPDLQKQRVGPPEAFYHAQMKEFLLMYDDVRTAASPNRALMEFLQSTYNAAADLGKWDRKSLER